MAANPLWKSFSLLLLLLAIVSGTALAEPAVNLSDDDKALVQDGFVIVREGTDSSQAITATEANPLPVLETSQEGEIKEEEAKVEEDGDADPGFASAMDSEGDLQKKSASVSLNANTAESASQETVTQSAVPLADQQEAQQGPSLVLPETMMGKVSAATPAKLSAPTKALLPPQPLPQPTTLQPERIVITVPALPSKDSVIPAAIPSEKKDSIQPPSSPTVLAEDASSIAPKAIAENAKIPRLRFVIPELANAKPTSEIR